MPISRHNIQDRHLRHTARTRSSLDSHHYLCVPDHKLPHSHLTANRRPPMAHPLLPILKGRGKEDIVDRLHLHLASRPSLLVSRSNRCHPHRRTQAKHHRSLSGINHPPLKGTGSSHINNRSRASGASHSSPNTANLPSSMDSNLTANMFVLPHVTFI